MGAKISTEAFKGVLLYFGAHAQLPCVPVPFTALHITCETKYVVQVSGRRERLLRPTPCRCSDAHNFILIIMRKSVTWLVVAVF